MAYFIPAIFTTVGVISPEWKTTNATGEILVIPLNCITLPVVFYCQPPWF